MDAQPLFRCSLAIREQVNGYYEVTIGSRFEHGAAAATVVYHNLAWAEVQDLVSASVDDWNVERTSEHQVVLPPLWVQLTLVD